MVEETARVIRADNTHVWLQVERKSTCGSCSMKKGCGTSLLSEYFNRNPANIKLPNTQNAKPGDIVVLGLSESAILKGSFLVYLIPITSLLVGAVFGQWLAELLSGNTELFAIVGGLGGLIAGAVWSKRKIYSKENFESFQPVILKVL